MQLEPTVRSPRGIRGLGMGPATTEKEPKTVLKGILGNRSVKKAFMAYAQKTNSQLEPTVRSPRGIRGLGMGPATTEKEPKTVLKGILGNRSVKKAFMAYAQKTNSQYRTLPKLGNHGRKPKL